MKEKKHVYLSFFSFSKIVCIDSDVFSRVVALPPRASSTTCLLRSLRYMLPFSGPNASLLIERKVSAPESGWLALCRSVPGLAIWASALWKGFL